MVTGIYKISILSRVHSVQEKTHLKRLVEEKGKEKEVLKGKEAAEKKLEELYLLRVKEDWETIN